MFKKTKYIVYMLLCCMVAICDCNAANEFFRGFECNQGRDGKEYLFTDTDLPGRPINNPAVIYKCIFNQSDNSGSWAVSPDSILQFCFDDDVSNPVHTNPQNFKVGTSISNIRAYVNPNINPVPGTTFVYEYTNNKDDMCTWCLPDKYGYYYISDNDAHMGCFDKEEEALCAYANDKNGEHTEWKNGKCKCTAPNQTWNKDRHLCEEEKHGLKCTHEIESERYVFLEEGPTALYECLIGKWFFFGEDSMNRCFSLEDFNDVNQTPPDVLEYKRGDSGYGLYINKNYPSVANKIYKYSDDINNMCIWCSQPAAYPYIDEQGDILCDPFSEEAAWCEFAKSKKQQNVKWENGECKCTEENQIFDNNLHICKDNQGNIVASELHGFKCTPERYNHQYIFLDEEESYYSYKCLSDGTWEKSDKLGFCYNINENSIGKPAPTGFDKSNHYGGWATYIKTGTQHIIPNIYEYTDDVNIMCLWVDTGLFLSLTENGKRLPYESLDEAWCMYAKYKENGEKVIWEDNECKCTEEGQTWNTTEHTCKPANASDNEEESEQTCEELYGAAGQEEALACCKLEKENKTTLHKKTNGDFERCECKEPNTQWKDKQCKPKSVSDDNNAVEQTCEEKYPDNLTAQACCKVGESVATWNETTKKCDCKHNKEWQDNKCVEKPTVSEKEFKTAKEKVDNFFKNADKNASVWKDASGKFNTARLASDLTAGVVLGTVGGVVSGVVIKKKQIEKGFEVLHCAIGGQSVANWGDTFTVGLNR